VSKKKLILIKLTILIIILAIVATYVVFFSPFIGLLNNSEQTNRPTSSYSTINVEEAYQLLNTGRNINLIDDPVGCHCRYDEEHIGDFFHYDALLVTRLNYGIEALYNTTDDTIIYDDDGLGEGLVHCEALVNHVYGDIYYLEGGLDAWKAKGYPVITE